MTQEQAIGFAVLMVVSIFLLMPTLLYMCDKLNTFGDHKRSFLVLWFLWPFVPFMYVRIWRSNRGQCKLFPAIVWFVFVFLLFGGALLVSEVVKAIKG